MPTPYRADHVGSLLRPAELIEARAEHAAGRLSAEQVREQEDAAVLRALAMQQAAGIDIYSGGEYRRGGWSTVVRESISGLAPSDTPPGNRILGRWQGPHGDLATASMTSTGAPLVVAEEIKQVRRLAGDEAAFLRQHAPGPWKITLPGPVSAAGQLYQPGVTDKVYPTRQDLVLAIAAILRAEIEALIAEGCSYIQLDSLHYVERIAYATIREQMIAEGEDPEQYLDDLIAADNAVLAGARQAGVTVGLHMCRGNNRSAWHAEGSYEPIADKAFSQLNVDRFLLEYDTERAGGFEPLRFVPPGKMVVLGLVSSKEPALESEDDLLRRIDEAAKYVPVENLALSPQCGFASTVLGNLLTWEEQQAKLALVARVARRVWG